MALLGQKVGTKKTTKSHWSTWVLITPCWTIPFLYPIYMCWEGGQRTHHSRWEGKIAPKHWWNEFCEITWTSCKADEILFLLSEWKILSWGSVDDKVFDVGRFKVYCDRWGWLGKDRNFRYFHVNPWWPQDNWQGAITKVKKHPWVLGFSPLTCHPRVFLAKKCHCSSCQSLLVSSCLDVRKPSDTCPVCRIHHLPKPRWMEEWSVAAGARWLFVYHHFEKTVPFSKHIRVHKEVQAGNPFWFSSHSDG